MNFELEQALKKCTPKNEKGKSMNFNKGMSDEIEDLEQKKELEL
jgi:hypothetical protein